VTSLLLEGRRILVTRAAHQAGKLSDGLRALGALPVEVPVLEIRPPASFVLLDAALHNLHRYDWLILTSANTVRALADRVAELNLPLAPSASLQVAAIGEATATAARKAGFSIALVPESYVAEGLVKSLAQRASGKSVLLARAEIARDLIPDALREAGALVDVVDAYRNVLPDAAPELLRQALAGGIDAATFTSSSSVTHLANAAEEAGISFPFPGVAAISIGPITTAMLQGADWPPAAEATVSDIPGLVKAVVLYFTSP
jgi:uroporphyrinogen-III synthase